MHLIPPHESNSAYEISSCEIYFCLNVCTRTKNRLDRLKSCKKFNIVKYIVIRAALLYQVQNTTALVFSKRFGSLKSSLKSGSATKGKFLAWTGQCHLLTWCSKQEKRLCCLPRHLLKLSKWVVDFLQKTNKNKSIWGIIVVKLNSFVHFLEEIDGPQKPFRNWLTLNRNIIRSIKSV